MPGRWGLAVLSLASEIRCQLDPGELVRRVGMLPDPWQQEYLLDGSPSILLLNSRQAGKSTMTAAKALHRAMFEDGSLVLVIAAAERQALELMEKVRALYFGSPAVKLSGRGGTLGYMRFENGSRLVALPAKEATIRSYSGVSLLIIDEASRVPDSVYAALRPMLATSGGDIVLATSPFGMRGFFWKEWCNGLPAGWEEVAHRHVPDVDELFGGRYEPTVYAGGYGWKEFLREVGELGEIRGAWSRYFVTAEDCPRIPREFLQDELDAVGRWWWTQEYFCEFHEESSAAFDFRLVLQSLSESYDAFMFGAGAEDSGVDVSALVSSQGAGFFAEEAQGQ